ncbi:hypothetical protein EV361DRAFT_933743 [Lentinula raphanica]|nr:hypothetical protein F5880DRAFT_1503069 [Lentinula raphanica]KAJ3966767.1 hypothetical protein EV361DRAFT_933743 [Lentinula raphanica]
MEKGRLATLDTEIRVLDAQLEILGRQEAHIRHMLDEMQMMHLRVVAERTILEDKRKETLAQREPINWLPGEILIEVFLFLRSSPSENNAASIEDSQNDLVNITHTCSKWRRLAIFTSRLWTTIRIPCTGWSKGRVSTFIARSSDAPLDVIFGGSREKCSPLSRDLTRVLALVVEKSYHLRHLSIDCTAIDSAVMFGRTLNDRRNHFPILSFLSIAITRETPHFTSSTSTVNSLSEFMSAKKQSFVPLKHLRMQSIPHLALSPRFYFSLTTLDISFVKRPIAVKEILVLLKIPRQLSHLSLSIQSLMTPPNPASSDVTLVPIVLPNLKHVELSFGHPAVLPRLFSYLDTPGLEKIELWLDTKHHSLNLDARVTPFVSESQWYATHQDLRLSSLKDLTLQFISQDQDLLSSVLRCFNFPNLQNLEIVNTSSNVRLRDPTQTSHSFPPIPRFEYFFRDPRFPYLTHLSLSHFVAEDLKIAILLGYIPALISLSLDTVQNCDTLLHSLALRATLVAPGQSLGWMTELSDPNDEKGHQAERRMKFCPKLEALSLWGCELSLPFLRLMLVARNGVNQDVQDDSSPYTTIQQSLSKRPGAILPARRVIKPLRKSKIAPGTTSPQRPQNLTEDEVSSSVSSTLDTSSAELVNPAILQAMQASAAEPSSKITYLRLTNLNCPGLDEESVGRLEKLVDDVIWTDS